MNSPMQIKSSTVRDKWFALFCVSFHCFHFFPHNKSNVQMKVCVIRKTNDTSEKRLGAASSSQVQSRVVGTSCGSFREVARPRVL